MSPPQKKVFSSSSHLKNIEPLSPHRATWNHWTTQTSAVVPQFGIANLVQISPISLGLMNGGYIYSIHGDCKPTNITRGYHLVTCKIGNTKKRKSLSFPWVNTPQACFLVDEPTIVCRFNPHLCCHFFFGIFSVPPSPVHFSYRLKHFNRQTNTWTSLTPFYT